MRNLYEVRVAVWERYGFAISDVIANALEDEEHWTHSGLVSKDGSIVISNECIFTPNGMYYRDTWNFMAWLNGWLAIDDIDKVTLQNPHPHLSSDVIPKRKDDMTDNTIYKGLLTMSGCVLVQNGLVRTQHGVRVFDRDGNLVADKTISIGGEERCVISTEIVPVDEITLQQAHDAGLDYDDLAQCLSSDTEHVVVVYFL
jgi:hypothetical protein